MSTENQNQDVYTILKENTEKYYDNVEKATTQSIEAINDFSEEYMTAWKNVVLSTISVQQQFVNQTGTKTDVPDAFTNIFSTTNEQISKALDAQNKINSATINTAKQNFKAFNENASKFTELNQNIVKAWASCIPERN